MTPELKVEVAKAATARLRQRLYDHAKACMDLGLQAMDAEPDNAEIAKMVYEVWSRHMGAVDAMVGLRGISQQNRQQALRLGMNEGRVATLDAHDAICPGCELSVAIRQEIDGLN